MKLFESVPNFSEGRDAAKVEAIAAEARSVPGVAVLDVESNPDHNRCVISLAGGAEALIEANVRMIRRAIATIDLTHHTGEHPRMGAADVVPFVPLGESTMADAVAAAERLALRVWTELHLPVYLYAAAARRPERSDLAVVRKGGFEGIRDAIQTDPSRAPDFGEPRVHPTAGIVAIGARPVLIAFNAYLSTPDVAVAKKVAHAVRARDGGLAEVKALGFDIKERQRAQVSMNLTDYRKTPVHRALEAVRREADRFGVTIEESEVVGLIPEDALHDAAEYYLQLNRFDRAQILERKVRASTDGGPSSSGELSSLSLVDFAERLAARTPTPGGGSAAAASAALGTALGEMVLAYSKPSDGSDAEFANAEVALRSARARFLTGIDEDSRAFEAVRTARKALKAEPLNVSLKESWVAALRRSAEVPLATAREARAVSDRLQGLRPRIKPTIASDLTTAVALLDAAVVGALANVEINVAELRAAGVSVEDLVTSASSLRSLGH